MCAVVVELVDGSRCVSSEFSEIGGVVLVHLLGEADVVVAANAAALVLAEEYGPLVLADGLVVLAEPTGVSFEEDEGVSSFGEGSVDGPPAFFLVESCLVEQVVHEDIAVCWLLGLGFLLHHVLDGLLLPLLVLLLLLLLVLFPTDGFLPFEGV